MHYLTSFELLHVLNSIRKLNLESLFNACLPDVHKRGIHTHRHTHMTIALGEIQRIAIRQKSKAYCDDPVINGLESGFNEGNAFYIGYIHLF